ncbi:MAG: hypothetical protein ABI593_00005, partial [Betaproteobacteria bacterium]
MLQVPPPAWDDVTLRTAEHELARALGPMAKLIVRRAASQTNDRAELCSILSGNIVDPDARRQFVAAFNQGGSGVRTGATGGSGAHATGSNASVSGRTRSAGAASVPGGTLHASAMGTLSAPLEQAFVDLVTARLAVYLGPIAQIVTKKAARGARSRSEFVQRVADNLGTQERAAFLREFGYGES